MAKKTQETVENGRQSDKYDVLMASVITPLSSKLLVEIVETFGLVASPPHPLVPMKEEPGLTHAEKCHYKLRISAVELRIIIILPHNRELSAHGLIFPSGNL